MSTWREFVHPFLVLLDVYVKVMNTSVTCPQMLLTEHPSFFFWTPHSYKITVTELILQREMEVKLTVSPNQHSYILTKDRINQNCVFMLQIYSNMENYVLYHQLPLSKPDMFWTTDVLVKYEVQSILVVVSHKTKANTGIFSFTRTMFIKVPFHLSIFFLKLRMFSILIITTLSPNFKGCLLSSLWPGGDELLLTPQICTPSIDVSSWS